MAATDPLGDLLLEKYRTFLAGIYTADFVDGDVTIDPANTITEAGHPFVQNDLIQLSTTGTLPTGLNPYPTNYWIDYVDASTVRYLDAFNGSIVVISAATGGGTHTMTRTFKDLSFDETKRLYYLERLQAVAGVQPKNLSVRDYMDLFFRDQGYGPGNSESREREMFIAESTATTQDSWEKAARIWAETP